MKTFVLCMLVLFLNVNGHVSAQVREEQQLQRAARGKEGVGQDEMVSFKNDLSYIQAIKALSELSKKFLGKPIVDPAPKDKAIGVGIDGWYWRDALETVLRTNGLWYREEAEYFLIFQPGAQPVTPPVTTQITQPTTTQPIGTQPPLVTQLPTEPPKPTEAEELSKSREVTISAIFLEVDQTKAREIGVNFSLFKTRGMEIGFDFQGAQGVRSSLINIEARQGPTRRVSLDIETALRFFESEALGEVIARPQVTVRTGQKGRVQIGQDFSFRSRTISGDVIENFYSTGTILEVTPKVHTIDNIEFIDLTLQVERSSVVPGEVTTLINKSKAESKLLLLDKEESYVGGLYVNEETNQRQGIPFLKDLPWWFFGLRYVFGYDAIRVARKELIVLIKAELVPMLDQRVTDRDSVKNLLQEKVKEGREDTTRRLKKD